MNRSLRIEYPSSLPDALHQTPAEFEQDARFAMAMKLFEMKRLSSGQAALLAGIDRTTFLMRLAESGVAMINLPAEELVDDIRNTGPAGSCNQYRARPCPGGRRSPRSPSRVVRQDHSAVRSGARN